MFGRDDQLGGRDGSDKYDTAVRLHGQRVLWTRVRLQRRPLSRTTAKEIRLDPFAHNQREL